MMRSELLLLPQRNASESARGYLLRAAADNLLPRMFNVALTTLETACEFLVELRRHDVSAHAKVEGKLTPTRWKSEGPIVCMLGQDTIPESCLLRRARRVCPLCLRDKPWSRIEWEVRTVQACPVHRIKLVSVCPHCKRPLQWGTSTLMHCFCGQDLAHIESTKVTPWDVIWASHVRAASATSRLNIQRPLAAWRQVCPTRLSKLLLLADVIYKAFLPMHLHEEMKGQKLWWLTVKILADPAYSAYMWDAIFLHAAENPLRLAEHLTPGRNASKVIHSYGNVLRDLVLPAALRKERLRHQVSTTTSRSKAFFDVRKHGIGPDLYRAMHIGNDLDLISLLELNDHQHDEEWT